MIFDFRNWEFIVLCKSEREFYDADIKMSI